MLKNKIEKLISLIENTQIEEIEVSSFWGAQKIKLSKSKSEQKKISSNHKSQSLKREVVEKEVNTELHSKIDSLIEGKISDFNKPKDKNDALNMLLRLSDNTHKVITGVCIKTQNKELIFSSTTIVTFKKLSELEIKFYIDNFNTLDKAGSYGIQEWIGKIGISKIVGSYTNVVGLPLKELYENLQKFN